MIFIAEKILKLVSIRLIFIKHAQFINALKALLRTNG